MEIIRDTVNLKPQPCVATIGFFDGSHTGHRYLVQQVKEIAKDQKLQSALITFSVHPRKVMNPSFHPFLLTTQEEKLELLAQTGVDRCFVLDFTPEMSQFTAQEFMRKVLKELFQVQSLVIGYDHRFGHNRSEGFEDYVTYGKEMGMEVIRAKAYEEKIVCDESANEKKLISSSVIRHLLLQGNVEKASHCLGYPYFLNGMVVSGYQVGRKIGFPTANLQVNDADKLIPADGVYAVWVTFNGQRHMGMLNIGFRPTLDNGKNRTIEVHILHFQSDIYNASLQITFVKHIRPELKFPHIEALIKQLHRDAAEVEATLSKV